MENESIAIWNCITVEVGHKKQDAADYLLYGSSFIFRYHGRDFTSIMPESKDTLVPAMTVMGVSMGALIGLPPSLVEIYGSGMKKFIKQTGYLSILDCSQPFSLQ